MQNKKIWIIASFICIISGSIILTAGRLIGGHSGFYIDGKGIHSASETYSAEPITDAKDLAPFERMDINVDYADVELVASDKFAIDYCLSGEYGVPVCEVKNGKLVLDQADSFKFINFGFFTNNMGVAINTPKYYVRIEIPKDQKLSDASFTIECGDLDISELQADTLKIENDYGDVNLNKYEGKKLDICMESGALFIDSMTAAQTEIKSQYGDIAISEAKGDSLNINVETGNCQIDCMEFLDTRIKNDYGDISLGLFDDSNAYELDLYAEYGDILIENSRQGYENEDGELSYHMAGDGEKNVTASCESGNIDIHSAK